MNHDTMYFYTLAATFGTLLSVGALIAGSAWLWALRSWREAAPLVASTTLYLLLFFTSPPPAIQAAMQGKAYSVWDTARLVAFGVSLMILVHSAYKVWCESSGIKEENARLKAANAWLNDRLLEAQLSGRPLTSGHFGGGDG